MQLPIHKKKWLPYFYSVSSCSVFRQTADFSLVETAAGESFSFFLFPSFPLSIGSAITKRLSLQISRGEEGHCLATQLYQCTICDFITAERTILYWKWRFKRAAWGPKVLFMYKNWPSFWNESNAGLVIFKNRRCHSLLEWFTFLNSQQHLRNFWLKWFDRHLVCLLFRKKV